VVVTIAGKQRRHERDTSPAAAGAGSDAAPAGGALAVRGVPGGALLPVRVVPRAARTGLDGVVEGALRVRLTAPPVEGAANAALIEFLAGRLGLPRSAVTLVAGAAARHKTLRIAGLTPAEVRARLGLG
jgi:uncharacterized protein (TIGR00251 family)